MVLAETEVCQPPTPVQNTENCTHVRGAPFHRAKIAGAEAVHRVRFKAEMSRGKRIRNRAKRSMNIHEKNAVPSHALCAIGSRHSAIFLLMVRGSGKRTLGCSV